MDPAAAFPTHPGPPAPRACGDGPASKVIGSRPRYCSPRVRGWTPRRPHPRRTAGPAPRACGDGPAAAHPPTASWPCSPRVRGWTPGCGLNFLVIVLLPARAGMDPPPTGRCSRPRPAPRACGDGPSSGKTPRPTSDCSPRVRGWTPGLPRAPLEGRLLPARAGMDPHLGRRRGRPRTAPRACGDGPPVSRGHPWKAACSPRVRGWTRIRRHQPRLLGLLPARAGDGPRQIHADEPLQNCSPRMRGRPRERPPEMRPHCASPAE